MEGGFFLLQDVDLVQDGQKVKGIEIIGHELVFGAEQPSKDIKSRFYDVLSGMTLDYMYEIDGDILMIWGGERGSPASLLLTPLRQARMPSQMKANCTTWVERWALPCPLLRCSSA